MVTRRASLVTVYSISSDPNTFPLLDKVNIKVKPHNQIESGYVEMTNYTPSAPLFGMRKQTNHTTVNSMTVRYVFHFNMNVT